MTRFEEILSHLDRDLGEMVKSGTTGAKLQQYRNARERLVNRPEDDQVLDEVERMRNASRDLSAGLTASLEHQVRRLRRDR